jgi:hypothetical protein
MEGREGMVAGIVIGGFGIGGFLFGLVSEHLVNPDGVQANEDIPLIDGEDAEHIDLEKFMVFPFDEEVAGNLPRMLRVLSFCWGVVMLVTVTLIQKEPQE